MICKLGAQILEERGDRGVAYTSRTKCYAPKRVALMQIEDLIRVLINVEYPYDMMNSRLRSRGRNRERGGTICGKNNAVMDAYYSRYTHRDYLPLPPRPCLTPPPLPLISAGQRIEREPPSNDLAHGEIEAVFIG